MSSTRPGLVRIIGRWDLTAAVVNAVIGSSIFGLPSELARLTGAASPLAAVYAGVGILAIVLCFAEVASRFQEPGGPYLLRIPIMPFLSLTAAPIRPFNSALPINEYTRAGKTCNPDNYDCLTSDQCCSGFCVSAPYNLCGHCAASGH